MSQTFTFIFVLSASLMLSVRFESPAHAGGSDSGSEEKSECDKAKEKRAEVCEGDDAEACEKEGLAIGKLEPSTITKLDGLLSSRWPRRNPVDMAGPSAAEISVVSSLLWAMMEDKNLDFIFLLAPIIMDKALLAGRLGLNPEAVKAYREKEEKNIMLIREKVEEYQKPVVLMWQLRGYSDPETTSLFRKARFVVCANARRAASVLKYLVWYRQYLAVAAGK